MALQILLNDTYKLNHCKEMGANLGRRFLKQPAEKLKAVFVAGYLRTSHLMCMSCLNIRSGNTGINDPKLLVQSRGHRSRTVPLFRHKE